MHLKVRIPGAVFLSMPMIEDGKSKYSHTIPSNDQFSLAMEKLGVRKSDTIVCYDNANHVVSARVSWMLRSFGASKVSVLNGTLYKWLSEKRPIDEIQDKDSAFSLNQLRTDQPKPDDFDYKLNESKYASYEDVLKWSNSKENLEFGQFKSPYIIDTRPVLDQDDGTILGSQAISFQDVLVKKGEFGSSQSIVFKTKENIADVLK